MGEPDLLQRLGDMTRRLENQTAQIIIDEQGVIEVWSAAAEALLGWTAAEAVGRPLVDLVIPPALQEAHRAGLQRWRETGTGGVICRSLRTDAVHKDGTHIPVLVTVQVMLDSTAGTRFLGWVERANG